jgi:CHRD domain-containing protein
MRKISFIAVAAALACGGSSNPTNVYVATMTPADEVPPVTGSTATGTATFTVFATTVDYVITFQNLSSGATVAHIHGGAAGATGVPAIPSFSTLPKGATSGNFTGTFAASDIVASTGITAGDLNSLVAAMKAGTAYANIHSSLHGSGEIRGQIKPR